MSKVEKILSLLVGALAFSFWSIFIYPNFDKIMGRPPQPADYVFAYTIMFTFIVGAVYLIQKFSPLKTDTGVVES